MKMKTLTDVFPDWSTGSGIFAALQELSPAWSELDIAESLDLEYFGNISGNKPISPLINKIMEGDSLTDIEINLLANVIYDLNAENWEREFNTLSAEYNPIENYSMTEEMTDDETVTDYGHTHTKTNNLTDTNTPTNWHTITDSSVYGFNSADGSPSDSVDMTMTGSQTDTHTGTVTDVDTGNDTNTRNYTLTRSGNIGVTTSQQMLQSERDLWMWNYFYDIVFPSIDKILALRIY